jgi:formate hydrogenlyase subunit 3/multisubunit Na+/H+ antiporter MnhD subunit
MSVLLYVAVTLIAATAAVLMRRSQDAQIRCGVIGLAFAALVAAMIRSGDAVTIGGIVIVGTGFASTFLLLASLAGLLIMVLSAVTSPVDDLAATTLAMLALVALALSVADPTTAVILLVAAGFLGVVLTLGPEPAPRDVVVVAREVRVLTVVGVAAMVAVAWIASPIGREGPPGIVFGLAYLTLVLAVALRFGAIPFHLWAARLADTVSELALPLLIAWLPCALAVVALGWVDTRVAPLEIPLDNERLIVAVVAVLTLVGGAFAAVVQDDIRHVAGYSMLGDAGFILLGLTILEPTGWEPTRIFILVYVVSKAALATWAAAVESAFGSRHLDDLPGWGRRAPLLGAAFLAIVVATFGLPGLTVWEARYDVATEAAGGLPGTAIFVAGLAPLVYYGRILAIGLTAPGALVRAGPIPTLRRPDPALARWDAILETWRLNRAPIAGGVVLALALLAVLGSAGGLGVPDAARSLPPAPTGQETAPP